MKIAKRLVYQLLYGYLSDLERGSLNYLWEIRFHLFFNNDMSDELIRNISGLPMRKIPSLLRSLDMTKTGDVFLYLLFLSFENYIYVNHYLSSRLLDRSMTAVLKQCFSGEMIHQLQYSDSKLDVLSNVFNLMLKSGRKNLHCYDCGTVARGVFYNLIKEHRGNFNLTWFEIQKLREDYLYLEHGNAKDGLMDLMESLRGISKSAVFIVGLKFGQDKFGHIFVIEKLWLPGMERPTIRFYQSALNSYLLIDYLVASGYLEDPLRTIDLDDFERDMLQMISVRSWGERENGLFVKWFRFYPQNEVDDTTYIRINSSYVTYDDV